MEYIDIVSINDFVIASAPKKKIYERKLPHRIAHVLVFNSKGEVFLQKRSNNVHYLPGHWCTSAGGHVKAGEKYKDAALRELKEEINLEGEIHQIAYFKHRKPLTQFIRVFKMVYDKPIDIKNEEVEGGRFFTMQELKQLIESKEFINSEWKAVLERVV